MHNFCPIMLLNTNTFHTVRVSNDLEKKKNFSWRSLLGCQLQGQPVSSLLSNVFHKNKCLTGNTTQLSLIILIKEGLLVVSCFHLIIQESGMRSLRASELQSMAPSNLSLQDYFKTTERCLSTDGDKLYRRLLRTGEAHPCYHGAS